MKFLENGTRPQPPTSPCNAWTCRCGLAHVCVSIHACITLSLFFSPSLLVSPFLSRLLSRSLTRSLSPSPFSLSTMARIDKRERHCMTKKNIVWRGKKSHCVTSESAIACGCGWVVGFMGEWCGERVCVRARVCVCVCVFVCVCACARTGGARSERQRASVGLIKTRESEMLNTPAQFEVMKENPRIELPSETPLPRHNSRRGKPQTLDDFSKTISSSRFAVVSWPLRNCGQDQDMQRSKQQAHDANEVFCECFVYVWVHVYIQTNIRTKYVDKYDTYVYIHMKIYTYICIYICTAIYVRVYVQTLHIWMYTHTMCLHTYAHACAYIQTHIHTNEHAYKYTYMHTNVHTYIHQYRVAKTHRIL